MLLQALPPVIAQAHDPALQGIRYLHRARFVDKWAERPAPEIPRAFFLTLRPESLQKCIHGQLAASVNEGLEYRLSLLCKPVLVGVGQLPPAPYLVPLAGDGECGPTQLRHR